MDKIQAKHCPGCTVCPLVAIRATDMAAYPIERAIGVEFATGVNCMKEEQKTLTAESLNQARQAIEAMQRDAERAAYRQQEGEYRHHQLHRYPEQPRYPEHQRSFLSPEITRQIEELCRRDPVFDATWSYFTGRVRQGLDDHIVRGFIDAVRFLQHEMTKQRDALNDRNLVNIRSLGNAAIEVIKAYEAAVARRDAEYMNDAIEELDAAIYEINQKGVLGES